MYEFKIEDAERFAQEQHIKATRKRNELVFQKCPYCGSASRDREKFAINLQTGQFNCLRASCGAKGNMLTLARDFDFSLGRDADTYYRIGPQRHYRTFKKPEAPIEPKDAALEYMKSRGINEETVRKYQITANQEGNIIFPFLDEENQIQFIKYRNPAPKEGQNKEWCEKDCKPILFGMAQCNTDNKTLIITEGQMDSLSVSEAGYENAVSVPTGANGFTWVPFCWDWMGQFNKIIVFGDHEKGRITLYNELATRWRSKVWHVRQEDYRDCKDANEILQKYGPEQIKTCIEQAEQLPIPKAIDLSKVEYINPYDIEKLPTGINGVDDLLCGGLPFGQVVLITGKAGDGKSTFSSQILLNAINNGHKCFAYSGELPNYLFRSWIDYQAAGAKNTTETWARWSYEKPRIVKSDVLEEISEWYKGQIWLYDNTSVEDEEDGLINLLEQIINQYGIRVILLDNLMTALDLEPIQADKYDRQSLFMKKLARVSLQYDVLIMLVAHKRKDTGSTITNDNVSGSSDITNLASIVLSYERAPKSREDVGPDERLLKITKNRLFGRIDNSGFILKYDSVSKRIYSNDFERNREYGWCKKKPFNQVELEPAPF